MLPILVTLGVILLLMVLSWFSLDEVDRLEIREDIENALDRWFGK